MIIELDIHSFNRQIAKGLLEKSCSPYIGGSFLCSDPGESQLGVLIGSLNGNCLSAGFDFNTKVKLFCRSLHLVGQSSL